ncbi:hypothetical protein HELRODRAFT_161662 [Helobdella robusta]|uniref:COMM domain-containing protein n=1 Tax=Helobdella robusta TaxID=6412 RepID=T1ERR5_HELRO|nr:hypothetical protein HELRODRAFT_161662 [Helobdella robusta]ESO02396.1 hypothetical protein HELRODRAFT_161662 [Helobdella robusta]
MSQQREFHYCRGTPPTEDFESVRALNNITATDDKTLEVFLHCILKSFVGIKTDQFDEMKSMLSSKLNIPENEFHRVFESFKNILIGFLRKKVSKEAIAQDLVKLGLKEKHSILVATKIEGWNGQAPSSPGPVSKLLDVKWKFGITVATNDQMKASSTFIDLDLTVDSGSGEQKIFFELTLPQFYNFLHELESAKFTMEQYDS